MKKTSLLIGLSSLLFTTLGFLATKANSKFTAVTSGCWVALNGTSLGQVSNLGSGFTTTSSGFLHVAVLVKTNGPGNYTVLAFLRTCCSPTCKLVYKN